MNRAPVICFGQQPCGFFPRRYLYAKFRTARRLQREIGGEIVFFCHDSDHDPRETKTTLRHRIRGDAASFNFSLSNKVQKKFSPLYLKRVDRTWQKFTARVLTEYVDAALVHIFANVTADRVADFCLEMYGKMGLLDGIRVMRSSSPEFRRAACEIADYFVDVPYEGETVRARRRQDSLELHKGGGEYIHLPLVPYTKEQISPTRDTRLPWMQSVIHCTHYVAGASEKHYLQTQDAPDITYIERDSIDRPEEAYAELDRN